MKQILKSVLLLAIVGINSFSQEIEKPFIGISASLQDGQLDFLLPVWTGEQFVLAPALGIVAATGGTTDIVVGVVPRIYFHREKVSPFLSGRIGGIIGIPKTGGSSFDLVAGLGGGAEYFFDSNFSIGIETQLNVVKSDKASLRFANPGGTNINTATAIFATIYF